jgi:hypothetical protein
MASKESTSDLSGLDLVIMRHLNSGREIEEISRLVKAQPDVVGKEIARLQLDGYIGSDGTLTEKGLEAL